MTSDRGEAAAAEARRLADRATPAHEGVRASAAAVVTLAIHNAAGMPYLSRMPGMTLANMRQNGATSIEAWCECGHHATVNVDGWPDDTEVPNVRFRLRCSKCGKRPRQTVPSWPGRGPMGLGR